jgi:hypothetical protein
VQGKQPNTVIVVNVTWAFIHCGKALNRSKVWEDDYRASSRAWLLARSTLENSTVADIDLRKPPPASNSEAQEVWLSSRSWLAFALARLWEEESQQTRSSSQYYCQRWCNFLHCLFGQW